MNSPEASIRVGILCHGTRFERWQAKAIKEVMAVPGVSIVVLVVEQAEEVNGPSKRGWGSALYRLYKRRNSPAAMDVVDLSAELEALPVVRCRPVASEGREHFSPKELGAIGEYRPDVMLQFGLDRLGGDILKLPTHGIWCFHHGDPTLSHGGPPGFWEIMQDEPITSAVLLRLTDGRDGGAILRQGWFSTVDHSLAETQNNLLMHSAIWPAQLMRVVLTGDINAAKGSEPGTPGKVSQEPHGVLFLRFLFKQFRNKLRFHRLELTRHEEWNIGVLYQPITSLLEEKPSLNVRWLPEPAATGFRADPFGYLATDGQLNVLYEKYDRQKDLGSIARLRPKKDNVLKRSRTMLETGTHLSYPFIVEQDGNVYVIPESLDGDSVQLFKVNESNDGLEFVSTLLEEGLCSPTIIHHEGRWWMFGTKPPLANVELHIYHASDLSGPWTPHLLNPVKSDVRSARPAGTPFHRGSELWRPAQDNTHTDGGRVALNRVIELGPAVFREETVKFIGPLKGSTYSKGLHTLSAVGNITLVDGMRFVFAREQERRIRKRKLAALKRNNP